MNFLASFDTLSFPDSLAIAKEESLTIGSIDEIQVGLFAIRNLAVTALHILIHLFVYVEAAYSGYSYA